MYASMKIYCTVRFICKVLNIVRFCFNCTDLIILCIEKDLQTYIILVDITAGYVEISEFSRNCAYHTLVPERYVVEPSTCDN